MAEAWKIICYINEKSIADFEKLVIYNRNIFYKRRFLKKLNTGGNKVYEK
ncbi:hypothetical protein [Clostridium sp. C2-6-12]|nr:hypothetical protein [Clostridium sp. C2-6-12]